MEKYYKMKNSILLGNGVNRISPGAKSWSELLNSISDRCDNMDGVPYTLQYENLYLSALKGDLNFPTDESSVEYQLKQKIGEMAKETSRNNILNQLLSMNIESYMSTNYDEMIKEGLIENGFRVDGVNSDCSEKIYSIRRHYSYANEENKRRVTIWPIHGEAKYPKSIMLGYDQYCGSIAKLDSYVKGKYEYKDKEGKSITIDSLIKRLKLGDGSVHSWVDLFFTQNVHMIGFGLDYSEQDIWWVLNKRQRYVLEKKIKLDNKIYFYGCLEEDSAKKTLIEDFGLEVCSFKTPQTPPEWESTYQQMVDSIKKNIL